MATFVLLPGAGGSGFVWHRVEDALRRLGHDAIAVDLPAADDRAGLSEYTATALHAVGDRSDLVLVGLSLGGFIAPLVAEARPVDLMVLVNAMVPTPGESGADWWANTGHAEARAAEAKRHGDDPEDVMQAFFHDVPDDVRADVVAQGEMVQSSAVFEQRWPLSRWPDVPTTLIAGLGDRFFPVEFQHRVARERLGLVPEDMAGGHLLPLGQPEELVNRLQRCWLETRS